jgi:hypothetical protein
MALTKVQTIGIETGISLTGVTTVTTLNASTDTLSVGGTVNFGGNVSIAGTLTYEDVTNIDSVGIITARSAIVLSDDNAIHFRGVATDDADAILRASAGGGQLLVNSRNDTIINIDSNNDSSDAHFAVAHGAATGSSTELFRVQEDGSIGAGTDNPLSTFHIARGSDDNSILYITGADTSSEFAALGVGAGYGMLTAGGSGSTSTDLIFRTASSGTEAERMRIDSSGNIGVGTNSPVTGNSGGRFIHIHNTATDANRPSEIVFTNGSTGTTGGSGGTITYYQDDLYTWNYEAQDLIFGTSATERMRLTSSGNMGLGETSPDTRLHIKESTTGATGIFIQNSNGATNSSADLYFGNWSGSSTTTPQARIQAINTNVNTAATDLAFWTYNGSSTSERMRIDSSGVVSINQTSASNIFRIQSSSTAESNLLLQNSTSGTGPGNGLYLGIDGSAVGYLWNYENTSNIFATNNTERMRIDSSGNVFINRTSQRSAEKFSVDNGGQVAIFTCTANADHSNIQMIHAYAGGGTNATQISFQNQTATSVGSIKSNGSSTSFNTSSDYRLKENVVDLDGAITRVKQLSPKRFNFIVNPDTTVDGFLAHEAQTVVPEAITGTHNEVDDDNNPVYQGIDQSKLVPLLTAALQEAIAKIETLESQVAALQG